LRRAQIMGSQPADKVLKQLQLGTAKGITDQVFKHDIRPGNGGGSSIGGAGRPSHRVNGSWGMGNKVT